MQKERENRITEGVIWKELIRFSLPLLVGNFFQQLYNTVDSIVVGRFVNLSALAAVNSSMPVINTLIGFFLGIAVGSGVVLSQRYGARDEQGTQKTIHTALTAMLISGFIVAIVGYFGAPYILRAIDTPSDVFSESVVYLKTFFLGAPALVIYNTCAGLLQSVGDSRRPLIYLISACLTNIALDILFVAVFRLGIAGAAFATILAILLSAFLSLRALMRDDDIYKVSLKKLGINRHYLGKIFHVGLPSGLQSAIIAFSNVIVQRFINIYDTAAVAGVGSYNKIDAFILMPMMSLSLAATTFVGQNIGAGKPERVKKIAATDMALSVGVTLIMSLVLFLFWENLLRLFNDDPAMLPYGFTALKWEAPFYTLMVVTNVAAGVIRGAGESLRPMIIMVGSYCVLRVAWLYFQDAFFPSLDAVLACYPITWAVAAAIMMVYLLKGDWLRKAIS